MSQTPVGPRNIKGLEKIRVILPLLARATRLLFEGANVRERKRKGLSFADAFFNYVKMSFLENAVLKYRHPVRFGEKFVIDSAFPPYPSKALDKRLSNYINNLDMRDLPTGIVSISTTNQCPYNCAFCSTNAKRTTDDDLDEELLIKTIKSVENLGTPSIILHGGEPMFRYERFLRLVRSVDPDTCLWMFTTGFGVNEERAKELKNAGLFGVWVSLDHYDPETHNRLRGHPKAFDNALNAVRAFKSAGVYTCLSLVPPDDFEERANFIKYYDMAKDLGVAEIRIMEVKPSGRQAEKGVKPHSKVLEKLQKDLFKDPAFSDHPPISGLSTWLEKDEALGCQCRFEYLFITSKGEVQPCEATQISFGNIREEPFEDIYKRASQAFTAPSTGCIPMVMLPEIREYQNLDPKIHPEPRRDQAGAIVGEFRERGKIPGAYKLLWSYYEKRLRRYQMKNRPFGRLNKSDS
jgi:MoaA/NifB/PqqE/SkfB family radical SAM enzyme